MLEMCTVVTFRTGKLALLWDQEKAYQARGSAGDQGGQQLASLWSMNSREFRRGRGANFQYWIASGVGNVDGLANSITCSTMKLRGEQQERGRRSPKRRQSVSEVREDINALLRWLYYIGRADLTNRDSGMRIGAIDNVQLSKYLTSHEPRTCATREI